MDVKTTIISGLIGYVSFVIVGGLFSNFLLIVSSYLGSGMLGATSQTEIAVTMLWMGLIECISFAVIFDVFYEGIPKEGVYKGLIYGFVLWYINIFMSFLGVYAFGFLQYENSVADVFFVNILKILMLPAYGATLGWAYQRLKTHYSH